MGQRVSYVGDEIEASNRPIGAFCLYHPVQHRRMTWDVNVGVERVLHYSVYSALRVAPEEQPLLLTNSVLAPPEQLTRMTQVRCDGVARSLRIGLQGQTSPLFRADSLCRTAQAMMEDFSVPLLYVGENASLALLSSGHVTGTVLDSGEVSDDMRSTRSTRQPVTHLT